MNKGLFGNCNSSNEQYNIGEVVYSVTRPGKRFIKLDGSETKLYQRGTDKNFGQQMLKSDLLIWTTQTSNFGVSNINSITFANGIFVAGGSGGQLRTSTDAVTWTTQTSNFGVSNIASITFANGIFVAGGSGGQLRTSTDAVTWTTQTSNFGTTTINSVAYGNGLWVAVGATGQIRTSTDAVTWTTQTSNFGTTSILCIAYGNGLWVAGGQTIALRTSTDGITWVTRSALSQTISVAQFNSIAYGNGLWVATTSSTTTSSGGEGRISRDGINWNPPPTTIGVLTGSTPIATRGVAYANKLWVAANWGSATNPLTVSTDGYNWRAGYLRDFINTTNSVSVAYGNGKWVVGGLNGQLLVSSNTTYRLPDITYAWVKV